MEEKTAKETALRNNEYYCLQELFDYLYKRSENNDNFYDLIKYIIKEENIRLAYRNIKTNKGSKSKGLSGKALRYIANMKLSFYLNFILRKILNYEPSKIKQIGIPKSNGKIRYLGIKEPEDKIIEQSIYQILEPILTAKFHNNSNGFIKGRSCHRAIAQLYNYIITKKLYFVVDLDMKSFFDNVNHGKLLKQLYSSGIRDKNLLSLISKMLKAEIKDVGIPEKGTPQGGILSPLLANIVLNELDWWLDKKQAKEIRFVRYADDIKILCPTYSVARNMLDKTISFLDNRLKLEVSEEKTKIVNLKRNYTNFLGIKIKVTKKGNKYKVISHMTDKAKENVKEKVKTQIRVVKKVKQNERKCQKEIDKYNSIIVGIHNYYAMATMISLDLNNINFIVNKYIYRNLSDVLISNNKVKQSDFITKTYGKDLPYVRGKPIITIGSIKFIAPRYKGDYVNYFKEKSRINFYKNLGLDNVFILNKLTMNPMYYETVEFNDNVISKFCGQYGKYAITNQLIYDLTNCKAIKKNLKGNDKYDNILIVENKVKELIELKGVDDMKKIDRMKKGLTSEQIKKINILRKENSLPLI